MKPLQRAAMKIGSAAKYLDVSEETLRSMSDRGDVPCKRLNRSRYFLIEDLDKWRRQLPDWTEMNGQAAEN